MRIPRKRWHQGIVQQCLSFVARTVLALTIVFVVWVSLVWFLPHTMILLTIAAMVWYFARTGQWTRFSLRSLFVFWTGMVVIIATAALVPDLTLSGWVGVITKRIVIEVVDKTTKAPINNAEVVLTSRAARRTTKQNNKAKRTQTELRSSDSVAVPSRRRPY